MAEPCPAGGVGDPVPVTPSRLSLSPGFIPVAVWLRSANTCGGVGVDGQPVATGGLALFPSITNELPLNVTGDDTMRGDVAGAFATAAFTSSPKVVVELPEVPTDFNSQVLE